MKDGRRMCMSVCHYVVWLDVSEILPRSAYRFRRVFETVPTRFSGGSCTARLDPPARDAPAGGACRDPLRAPLAPDRSLRAPAARATERCSAPPPLGTQVTATALLSPRVACSRSHSSPSLPASGQAATSSLNMYRSMISDALDCDRSSMSTYGKPFICNWLFT